MDSVALAFSFRADHSHQSFAKSVDTEVSSSVKLVGAFRLFFDS
jgi:hypothetical protein